MNITDIAKVLRENEQVSSIDEGKEVMKVAEAVEAKIGCLS